VASLGEHEIELRLDAPVSLLGVDDRLDHEVGVPMEQRIGEHPQDGAEPEHVAPQAPRRLSLRAYRFIPLTEHRFLPLIPSFFVSRRIHEFHERDENTAGYG
jgi:hypothetical protein